MLKAFYHQNILEAGCDEAGRGCLAGPVFAAAVILPVDFYHPLLNDSKQMKESHREELKTVIEQQSVAWAVAKVDAGEIDTLNILNASIKAMHLAIDKLSINPDFLLIDGNRFKKYKNVPYKCFVGGDGIFASIAAASVIAKTYRDEYMKTLHYQFPEYGWLKNKAYGTKQHIAAIKQFGTTKHHRKSFVIKPKQFELFKHCN